MSQGRVLIMEEGRYKYENVGGKAKKEKTVVFNEYHHEFIFFQTKSIMKKLSD